MKSLEEYGEQAIGQVIKRKYPNAGLELNDLPSEERDSIIKMAEERAIDDYSAEIDHIYEQEKDRRMEL